MKYTSMAAAHDMLDAGDEVLAHSILFMWDSLFFWEFCDAIWDADVGRMWVSLRRYIYISILGFSPLYMINVYGTNPTTQKTV